MSCRQISGTFMAANSGNRDSELLVTSISMIKSGGGSTSGSKSILPRTFGSLEM